MLKVLVGVILLLGSFSQVNAKDLSHTICEDLFHQEMIYSIDKRESRASRLIGLMIRGLKDEVKSQAMHFAGLAYQHSKRVFDRIWKKSENLTEEHPIVEVTGRGILRYLFQLHLVLYDFTDKKILDAGSGMSKFANVINEIYGDTGTKATALDIAAKRDYENDSFVQGDVFKLPFEDESHDLVVSSWMIEHLWGNPSFVPKGERGEVASINEFIRITKNGGEIRLGLNYPAAIVKDRQYLIDFLKNHPRVESFSIPSKLWVAPPLFAMAAYFHMMYGNGDPSALAVWTGVGTTLSSFAPIFLGSIKIRLKE